MNYGLYHWIIKYGVLYFEHVLNILEQPARAHDCTRADPYWRTGDKAHVSETCRGRQRMGGELHQRLRQCLSLRDDNTTLATLASSSGSLSDQQSGCLLGTPFSTAF